MKKLSVALLALVLSATAFGAEEMPKPGKADTFELDRWMRRNKYPLTVKFIEHEGKGGKNIPVTFGLACGEGDFKPGQLSPALHADPSPAQVDVLSTWPDGSIKHALVSLVIGSLQARDTFPFCCVKGAPLKPETFELAVPLDDFVVRTEFEDKDGNKTETSISSDVMKKMAAVLQGNAKPGRLAPRLAGPVCYEFEVQALATTDGKPDPDIDVFYRLRFYSGWKGVRVAYVVENTRMPKAPYPKQFSVRDRDFTRLRFFAGPKGKEKAVCERGPLTQWYGTRYRVLRWVGNRPPLVHAKQSLAYLIYAQFFPKIDFDTPVKAAVPRYWKKCVRPIQFPDGLPMDSGPVYRHMPGTGGRPDIGPYAVWHRLALASDSPDHHYVARTADGNGLACFPIHRRSGNDRAPGAPHTDKIHPRYWYGMQGRRSAGLNYVRAKTRCPYKPDTAHTPSTAFYSYLTTGDRFFEEEMAFWAMYPVGRWPWPGISGGVGRASAWQLRNLTDAAFVLPDDHPRKKYLVAFVDRTVKRYAQTTKNFKWRGKRQVSGRKHWVCAGQGSFWQYPWYVWALDNAARKGWPDAAVARDQAADILFRMYEGQEAFKAPNGKTYRFKPDHAMAYSVAVCLFTVEYLDGGGEKETYAGSITDNTGAMYYYTMVNCQYMHYFAKKEDKAAWVKANVPKKVMRPEDWLLDPAFEKKFMIRPGGWHDYGNEPCAAAMARYDNPRAQKMYDFVRPWIDRRRGSGPRRIRGIEFVK